MTGQVFAFYPAQSLRTSAETYGQCPRIDAIFNQGYAERQGWAIKARRFSRQDDDDRPFHPVNVYPPFRDGAQIHQTRPCAHAETVHPEHMDPERPILQVNEAAAVESGTVPQDSERPLLVQVPAWRDVHQLQETSQEESLPAATRPDSILSNDQFSSNPGRGVPASLRSTSLSDPTHLAMDSSHTEAQGSGHSSISYPANASIPSASSGDRTLPADDGMSSKRKQIVAIHNTSLSAIEKAKLLITADPSSTKFSTPPFAHKPSQS
ncbi:MAG: hypothetical protein Q9169_000341 [Polycauliona sp. 2 TL-2023]